MKKLSIDDLVKKYASTLSDHEIAKIISKELNIDYTSSAVRWRRRKFGLTKNFGSKDTRTLSIDEVIKLDREISKQKNQKKDDSTKNKYLMERNDELEIQLETALRLNKEANPFIFNYEESSNKTEAIAVVIASDWHIEENVKSESVNGLNNFNLNVADKRAEQFFQNTVKLLKKEQVASKIDTLVLALLGDFISGNIHEELLETTELRPIDAIIHAENLLIGGIDYILKNTNVNLIISGHVGNHTRITKKVHIATEKGNSLETIMYKHMENRYRGNKRVKFLIADGYLSYLNLFNAYTICFQHGHAVKFGGGIGGLTIPMNKAIAQWEKLKHADLYILGHYHQFIDGGNFIVNGSLIGYNAFAVFIKAGFERPKQSFFLVSKKYGCKTVTTPVLFDI